MNELPLEEVMELVDKVDHWETFQKGASYTGYIGRFDFKPWNFFTGQNTYGKIYVRKTSEQGIKEGLHQRDLVTIRYNGSYVAGLEGKDADMVFERIRESLGNWKEPDVDFPEELKDKIRQAIAPKPEPLPLHRRLGK